jgi:hypothetical protein
MLRRRVNFIQQQCALLINDHVGTIPFISRYHVQQQQKLLQQKLKNSGLAHHSGLALDKSSFCGTSDQPIST